MLKFTLWVRDGYSSFIYEIITALILYHIDTGMSMPIFTGF